MARTTVSETVERIRRQLNSTVRLEINVLGGSINTTDTTLSFSYDIANSLRNGAVLAIGNELMRVEQQHQLERGHRHPWMAGLRRRGSQLGR